MNEPLRNVTLRAEERTLPRPGLIRGAPHKPQQVISAGTKVWIIYYVEAKRFYSGLYLSRPQAEMVAMNLKKNNPQIFEPQMWGWNFRAIAPHQDIRPIVARPI